MSVGVCAWIIRTGGTIFKLPVGYTSELTIMINNNILDRTQEKNDIE